MNRWIRFWLFAALGNVACCNVSVEAGFPTFQMQPPAASGGRQFGTHRFAPRMMPTGPMRQLLPQAGSMAPLRTEQRHNVATPLGNPYVFGPQPTGNRNVAVPRQSPMGPAAHVPAQPPVTIARQLDASNAALKQAVHHERSGDLRTAINFYHRALELDSTNRMALLSFARTKHRIGDLDGAIVTYRQCLTYHPNDAVALNDLGLCQARQGALDLAAKHLTKASCLHPENKRYANNLATVLVEQGKVNEALSALATSYGPAIAHYNLAHIQHRRGSYAAAVENLQVALKHDPSLSPAKQMIEALGGIETAALPPEPQLQAAPHGMESEVMGAVAPEPNLDLPLTSTDGPSTDVAQQLKRAQWNFLQGDKSRLAPSE